MVAHNTPSMFQARQGRRALVPAAILALATLLAACEGSGGPLGPVGHDSGGLTPEAQPLQSQVQAASSNADVIFLPPLGSTPVGDGQTDASAEPVVEICGDAACTDLHTRFDVHGQGPARVRVSDDASHHMVNWNTRVSSAQAGEEYWIRVLVDGQVLATESVRVEASASARRGGENQGLLVAGQTLPIRFRVGAPGEALIIEVEPEVSFLDPGGTVQLEATVSDGSGALIPGATPTWASSDENVATVDSNGMVTAAASGLSETTFAEITASWGGALGVAWVVVMVPEPCTPRESGRTRFANLSPGTPTLDVAVDGVPLGLELAFGEASDYLEFEGCSLAFVEAGDPDAVPVSPTRSIFPAWATGQSILLLGTEGDDDLDRLLTVQEDADSAVWVDTGIDLDPDLGYVEPRHAAVGVGPVRMKVESESSDGNLYTELLYLDITSWLFGFTATDGQTGPLNVYVDIDADGEADFVFEVEGVAAGEVAQFILLTDEDGNLFVWGLAPERAPFRSTP